MNLGLSTLIYLAPNTRFFISNTFIRNARLTKNWQKIKQMLSYTLRLNFCYLKIIHIPHTSHNPKTIRHILKNKQKNKCLFSGDCTINQWKWRWKWKTDHEGIDTNTNVINIKNVSIWWCLSDCNWTRTHNHLISGL